MDHTELMDMDPMDVDDMSDQEDQEDQEDQDQELFERHLKSWRDFDTAIGYLQPLDISIDKYGFSTATLNSKSENNSCMAQRGEKLDDYQIDERGRKRKNPLKNLTSLCGCQYKLFDGEQYGGSTMLKHAGEVSEFFLRLALTFYKTSLEKRQFIAPMQLRIYDSSSGVNKIRSKAMYPHLDLDHALYVPPEKVLQHVDEDGYILKSIQNLHFTKSQLEHHAKICIFALACVLKISEDEIFCTVMKTPIPGIKFVREELERCPIGWRFAPKVERRNGENVTKVKTSAWFFFGLKKTLEIDVVGTNINFFNGSEQIVDTQEIHQKLCCRMMRKYHTCPGNSHTDPHRAFQRGFGILLDDKEMSHFRSTVKGKLQESCVDKRDSWAWTIADCKLKESNIDVDDGAQGMRPPHASKCWECVYHETYSYSGRDGQASQILKKISPITSRLDFTEETSKNMCISIIARNELKKRNPREIMCQNLCNADSKAKDDVSNPTKCTKAPYVQGIHITTQGIDDRDLWLLTARCPAVIGIFCVLRECVSSIRWAERLLNTPRYGYMFETSLTNLFVEFNVANHPTSKDFGAGILKNVGQGLIIVPFEGTKNQISVDSNLPDLLEPWDSRLAFAIAKKGDSWRPVSQRIGGTATLDVNNFVLLSEFLEDLEFQKKVEKVVYRTIKCDKNFIYITKKNSIDSLDLEKKEVRDQQKHHIFVYVKSNQVMGLVCSFGPPSYCLNYGNNINQKKDRVNDWKKHNGHSRELNIFTDKGIDNLEYRKSYMHNCEQNPDSKGIGGNCLFIRFEKKENRYLSNMVCTHPACKGKKVCHGVMESIPNDKVLRELFGISFKMSDTDTNTQETHSRRVVEKRLPNVSSTIKTMDLENFLGTL